MRPLRRSLQLTGKRSYSITLPKGWVSAQGLKTGDSLILEVCEDGTIRVKPEMRGPTRENSKFIINDTALIGRDVLAAYLMGYDNIVIEAKKPLSQENVKNVKMVIRGLAGAEIIDEGENRIEIQILLDSGAVEPMKVLSRQNSLVKSMINDAFLSIINVNNERAMKVLGRDEEVDRHYFTLVRVVRAAMKDPVIASELKLNALQLMDIRLVAKFIEDVGDRAANMASHTLLEGFKGFSDEMNELLGNLNEVLITLQNSAFEAFTNEDLKLATEVIKARERVINLITKISKLQEPTASPTKSATMILLNADAINLNQVDIADIVAPAKRTALQ
ncbi:MAG: phosphate uptake regulator PhoU [Aigarchaeota archaeon]|nr:phosphate uptake regulator PhoU [Aigarchaeota archaeon]MDW8092199.1 phosphate uptake regulator PhoU [Nitrososphaerota archaeon]